MQYICTKEKLSFFMNVEESLRGVLKRGLMKLFNIKDDFLKYCIREDIPSGWHYECY